MDIFDALLARGYFPQELPPTFSTREFSRVVVRDKASLPVPFSDPKHITQTSTHRLARVGGSRRKLGIPNPCNHVQLCKCIDANWPILQTAFVQSTLSKSIPRLDKSGRRALIASRARAPMLSDRIRLRCGSRWVLNADVQQFYPSIYTHSIPWALHTKAAAKKNRKRTLLGNQLDELVRGGQDGQTNGIPIGPDSSFVIAELIMSKVDEELIKRHPKVLGIRMVDDYEIYVESQGKAEQILNSLQEILSEFELVVNSSKCSISELPQPLESRWVRELRQLAEPSSYGKEKGRLVGFFESAFTYSREFANDKVIKYALTSIFKNKHIYGESAFGILEGFLLQAVTVQPESLPLAIGILLRQIQLGNSIERALVGQVLSNHVVRHTRLGHDSEVAWAVWGAMALGVSLNKEATQSLMASDCCIVSVSALDAHSRGVLHDCFEAKGWLHYMQESELKGRHWLLAYEAEYHKWIVDSKFTESVLKDPVFSFLKNNRITFYRPFEEEADPLSDLSGHLFSDYSRPIDPEIDKV